MSSLSFSSVPKTSDFLVMYKKQKYLNEERYFATTLAARVVVMNHISLPLGCTVPIDRTYT